MEIVSCSGPDVHLCKTCQHFFPSLFLDCIEKRQLVACTGVNTEAVGAPFGGAPDILILLPITNTQGKV